MTEPARRDELHKTLTADITRLIGSLDWALRWIEGWLEAPLEDEQPEDYAAYQTAKALLAPPPSRARVEEGSVNG